MGSLLALLALCLFAANVFAVRSASTRLDQERGFLLALLANVAFGGVLFGVDLARRWGHFILDPGAFWTFALAGVLASYLGRRGFFRSVETLGPSRASAVQITNPMFAAVLAWAFLGESLGTVDIALITLVLLGLYLTTIPSGRSTSDTATGREPRWRAVPVATLWPALFSAVAYAGGNVLRAHGLDAWREPIFGGLVGAVAGTAIYAVLHVRAKELVPLRQMQSSGVLLWILAGMLTISAQISVIGATAYLSLAVVLVTSSALPVIVVPVSLLLRVETLCATTLLGSGMVLAGVTGILVR